MQIPQNKNKIGRTIFTLVGVAIVIAGIIFGLYLYTQRDANNTESNASPQSGATEAEKQTQEKHDAQQKQDFLDKESANTEQEPIPQVTEGQIQLSATDDGNRVTVLTKLASLPSGACTLTVKNGSQTTTLTADIIFQSEYSTCAGFSVDKSGLGTGNWSINLSVNANGSTLEKNISYKVQ